MVGFISCIFNNVCNMWNESIIIKIVFVIFINDDNGLCFVDLLVIKMV